MEKTVVGITCAGSLIGQGIIKSVRNSSLAKTIEMIGFEYFSGTISSYWLEKTFLMPDILRPGVPIESYMEVLLQRIREHGIRILFIGMDFELSMMAEHRQVIENETGCKVVVSSPEVIEIAEDKYETYLFLKENGLSRPQTWLPDKVGQGVVYPAIVKPRIGERSKGVHIVNNERELHNAIAGLKDPMIQEKVGSKEEEYTCAILFLDGALKSILCMRRYLRDGNTSIAFHSPDTPEIIYEYVRELAQKLKPDGPCNFQLRIGDDGLPRLFEINARFSGTTYIRTLFGLNEVEYVINHLIGQKPAEFKLRHGKVIRYMEEVFIPEGT